MTENNEKGFELMKALQEVAGDELDKIEMIERIKKILMDFLRGYPAWRYYGIIEFYFKGELGKRVIKVLKEHDIIDVEEENGRTYYWLKPKGIEITISLTNLDYSEKIAEYSKEMSNYEKKVLEYNKEVSKYSQKTSYFSELIIWLTWLLVVIGSMSLIIGTISIFPNIINAFTSLF